MFNLRKIGFISILLLMILPLIIVQAQDSCTNDPDDGSGLPMCGTPADNECYPYGVLYPTCNSAASWNAGWHLARCRRGVISPAEIPAQYAEVASLCTPVDPLETPDTPPIDEAFTCDDMANWPLWAVQQIWARGLCLPEEEPDPCADATGTAATNIAC